MDTKPYDYEHKLMFMGIGNRQMPAYPRWMYRDDTAPILVPNTDKAIEAYEKGFDNINAATMANRYLINWFWDLEDMSSKQLVVFARDEFGVNLPVEADQHILFKSVCELTKFAPQNRDRLILMAHEIRMNYDETLEEIKRMASGKGQNLESETEEKEFWA